MKNPEVRIKESGIIQHPWIKDYYEEFITKEVNS